MAVRTLTYRDLTPLQRAQGARKARERLLGLLNNPFLTVEQRQAVYDKIGNLKRWESLQLDGSYVPPSFVARPIAAAPQPIAALPPRSPQHHEVGVSEAVPATDKLT